MTTYSVFDAAYPPNATPGGCAGVLGYIGGDNALHVWTVAEWLRFQHLRQFPVWVPDVHGRSTPAAIGGAAVARANQLGWRSTNGERVIVIDLETFADSAWWAECAGAINRDGYDAVCYGSASTVGGNRAANVWAAKYDKVAALESTGYCAHQYWANAPYGNTKVDYSTINEWLYTRGGTGPRHGS